MYVCIYVHVCGALNVNHRFDRSIKEGVTGRTVLENTLKVLKMGGGSLKSSEPII